MIIERRVEGRRHLSSWDTNPTLRAEAGLISFLIHLANGYSFLYKMTCPGHSLDSRSPGLKLPCHRSPNTLASAYTSVTGTFNSPNAEGGKSDNWGASKGDSFCGAVDVVRVGVSSGGTPVCTSLPYATFS